MTGFIYLLIAKFKLPHGFVSHVGIPKMVTTTSVITI